MSGGLSERDEQVLRAASQSADVDTNTNEELPDDVGELKDLVLTLSRELEEVSQELGQERERNREFRRTVQQRLHALERVHDGEVTGPGTTKLEKYAAMSTEERDELLSPSQHRAVAIYQNWTDLSWKASNGYVVDTSTRGLQKNHPSRFKKSLEQVLGEDLRWIEIYRAMKAVAKLSGGEPEPDQYGRMHVEGGTFEYHEKVTPDSQKTKKVLVEVGP